MSEVVIRRSSRLVDVRANQTIAGEVEATRPTVGDGAEDLQPRRHGRLQVQHVGTKRDATIAEIHATLKHDAVVIVEGQIADAYAGPGNAVPGADQHARSNIVRITRKSNRGIGRVVAKVRVGRDT